jgi:hypothetical protein
MIYGSSSVPVPTSEAETELPSHAADAVGIIVAIIAQSIASAIITEVNFFI